MDPGLARGSLVLVDSSPLVYLIEGAPGSRRRGAVEAFLAYASTREIGLAASALIWTELLAKPLAAGDTALADRYRAFLADSRRLVLEPVDAAIAEGAARLMAARQLALGDAIHIATALALGAAAILGNDEAWRSVPGCPRLLLVDELAFGLDS